MSVPVPVIGLGAGGHAKVMMDILFAVGDFRIIGLLDSCLERKGQTVMGVPVLGDDSLLSDMIERGVGHFFMGVGSISDSTVRRRLYEMALGRGLRAVQAIHPRSIVSSSVKVGSGAAIMAGAIINAEAKIGVNVIINTGAIIEHDCVLEDHVHVATGARLAGAVHVGRMSHIGAGATVRQGITIGECAVVGAGAVVVRDVPPGSVVAGVPARPLLRN